MNLFGNKNKEKLFGWGKRKVINPDGGLFLVGTILPRQLALEVWDADLEMEKVRLKKMRQEDWKIATYKGEPKPEKDPMKDLKGFEEVTINEKRRNSMSEQQEVNIEISYERRYNLGDFNHKIYNVKLNGNQSAVEEQLKNHNAKLTKYLETVEGLVEKAHDANLKKDEVSDGG